MTKSISLVAVSSMAFIAFMFAMTMSASAASITNVVYQNGDVTIQGTAGQSVSGSVRIVVPANEEVEFVEFDIISDNLAPVCMAVNRLQENTHNVNIPSDVKFPPNTGTYNLQVRTSGIFGGLAAVDCVSNNNGSNSFNNSVRTVSSSSTVGNTTGSQSWMEAQIAMLMKLIADMKPATPAPAPVNAKCAALATKTAGAMYGTRNSANIVLQGFLLSEGANIPALAAGAAFGFYGDQTASALSVFKAANSCN